MKVFYNCHVRNFPNWNEDDGDSFVVDDKGLIIDVGYNLHKLEKYKNLSQTDLKNYYIFPAFADAHVHFLQTALVKVGCDLAEASSLEEIFSKLISYSRKNSEFEWVIAWNFDESKIAEKRFPTINELDNLLPNKKIWINRVDLHSAVLNSNAIQWASNLCANCDYNKGYVNKQDYSILFQNLINTIPQSYKTTGLKLALNDFIINGITTIHALEGGWGASEADVELVANFLEKSNISYVIYHQSEDPSFVIKNKWQQLGGCLMVDGSFGSRTAALSSPYDDDTSNFGVLYFDEIRIQNLIHVCINRNLQLAMHAIGDRAIELLTKCYYNAYKHFKKPLNFRIEHFELPTEKAITQVKEANIFLSVQPTFEVLWGGYNKMYAKRLGINRAQQTNPFKIYLQNNIIFAAGSDSPVTPVNPLLGLYGFIQHPTPEFRISLNDALSAYIVNPHLISNVQTNKGKIKKGFYADFVCLNEDIFILPKDKIKDIKFCSVFIKGNEYKSETFVNC